ncbi:hypothetical protein [Candidatus Enterovibrio altilux]|uniref:Mobile element protein n=1 Tax=Candidatus Enterovibrio altilux TaxID=1927128 RepID=A0A291B9C8_9GAMM|nr:hypothetical protein [Candidatus Enterovibrio luxaltus]ATF09610.1 Mobile element protein [Candidatus Enterovibrio luxaltus]
MVDINAHKIIAVELNASNMTGSEVLPHLLKQTRQKINEISGNEVCDTKQCYEIIRMQ